VSIGPSRGKIIKGTKHKQMKMMIVLYPVHQQDQIFKIKNIKIIDGDKISGHLDFKVVQVQIGPGFGMSDLGCF
jgi:hypothetical protein